MKKEPRPHWSYSALNQYLRCPLQYYFERILKIPRTSCGSGLILGSAVHSALAVYHLGIKHHQEIGWQQIQQEFLEAWVIQEERQTVDYKTNETRDDLVAQGLELLKLYLNEPPPSDIITVEQRMLVPLRNSEGEYLETPLLAFVDLITRDAGVLKVNEFKTSGRAYGEFEVESSLQATCYVNAVLESSGAWPTVEYAILVKTKTPKLQRLKTSRNENDLGRLGDLVENVERAVSNKIFYPVESPMNCSTCSYRQECREWKPERTPGDETIAVHELNGAEAC